MSSESKGMVLVARFSDAPSAQIAAGMLEDNGIAAVVEDSNMAVLYGAGATWAPVNLYVRSADAACARLLLREHGDI